jgi:hypothetical protein
MATPLAATDVDHGTILILITLIVLPIAAISFARAGEAWRNIGGGGSRSPAEDDSRATKEAEIRQMIEAKSYRHAQRGEPPLDVETEIERHVADLIGWGA